MAAKDAEMQEMKSAHKTAVKAINAVHHETNRAREDARDAETRVLVGARDADYDSLYASCERLLTVFHRVTASRDDAETLCRQTKASLDGAGAQLHTLNAGYAALYAGHAALKTEYDAMVCTVALYAKTRGKRRREATVCELDAAKKTRKNEKNITGVAGSYGWTYMYCSTMYRSSEPFETLGEARASLAAHRLKTAIPLDETCVWSTEARGGA